ncbi:MAG: glycosyltransferase [Propionibacteriaceae bacterium]|nr:glycosyltransferase [Propionibacteriaceae bacterium]
MTSRPRVAVAHDYLTQRGGAERVVLSLMRAFPDAPIYTTLYNPPGTYPEFADAKIVTSWLNNIPLFRKDHRPALPLLALAANSLRIDADVVIASSTGWAHGFPTSGRKLVYCHSPARYLYRTEEYLGQPARSSLKGQLLMAMRPALVRWDQHAARSADRYVCNSTVVQRRIAEVYGIESDVIAPPAGVKSTGRQEPVEQLQDWADGYYLVVSRLLPYKNVQRVIEAFHGTSEKLAIAEDVNIFGSVVDFVC